MTDRTIITDHVYPPIPMRNYDWCACYENDEEFGPQGWGRTEEDAIADLIESEREEVDNLTSFPPITDKEAQDIQAWQRKDVANV